MSHDHVLLLASSDEDPVLESTPAREERAGEWLLLATASVVAAVWARSRGQDWQTCMFLVLGAGQLGVALAVRARGAARHNPFFAVSVLAAALLQVLAVTLPPLHDLLNTGPLPADLWLGCLLLSILPGLLTWLGRTGRAS